MEVREIFKKRITFTDIVFSTEETYKAVRKVAEGMKYFFVEKEQELKPAKYGHERKFEFSLFRIADDFARFEISVEMKLENLNKVKVENKEVDKGDAEVIVIGKVHLDYKNEWAMSKLNRKLFGIYLNYLAKEKIKRLYFKTISEESTKIYDTIKEASEYYS